MQYSIFEGNLERLEQKLVRIQNKCKKYGADFHYEVVGEEFKEVKVDNKPQILRYVIVDVEGFAKVNGWEFIATIDHRDGGELNVIRQIVDIPVPERYWTSECYCEHCQTMRRRKDTFLVHNIETGEFKQVGRSCLRDFTGGYDADLAASYIAMYETLIESEEVGYGSGFTVNPYFPLETVLHMSKAIIAKTGFISTTTANEQGGPSSKSRLCELASVVLHGAAIDKYNKWLQEEGVLRFYETFNDDQYFEDMVKYYKENTDDSSYMMNMKAIFSSDYCKEKDFGYIVSAVACYDRELERREKKAIAEAKRVAESQLSQYVGEIKQKITFKVKSSVCVSSYEDNYGGYSYLYKFIDEDGNCYMWSTSNCLDSEKKLDTVTGTVKDHKEYKGLKQTWITRCKCTYKPKEEEHHEPAPYEGSAQEGFDLLWNYFEGKTAEA